MAENSITQEFLELCERLQGAQLDSDSRIAILHALNGAKLHLYRSEADIATDRELEQALQWSEGHARLVQVRMRELEKANFNFAWEVVQLQRRLHQAQHSAAAYALYSEGKGDSLVRENNRLLSALQQQVYDFGASEQSATCPDTAVGPSQGKSAKTLVAAADILRRSNESRIVKSRFGTWIRFVNERRRARKLEFAASILVENTSRSLVAYYYRTLEKRTSVALRSETAFVTRTCEQRRRLSAHLAKDNELLALRRIFSRWQLLAQTSMVRMQPATPAEHVQVIDFTSRAAVQLSQALLASTQTELARHYYNRLAAKVIRERRMAHQMRVSEALAAAYERRIIAAYFNSWQTYSLRLLKRRRIGGEVTSGGDKLLAKNSIAHLRTRFCCWQRWANRHRRLQVAATSLKDSSDQSRVIDFYRRWEIVVAQHKGRLLRERLAEALSTLHNTRQCAYYFAIWEQHMLAVRRKPPHIRNSTLLQLADSEARDRLRIQMQSLDELRQLHVYTVAFMYQHELQQRTSAVDQLESTLLEKDKQAFSWLGLEVVGKDADWDAARGVRVLSTRPGGPAELAGVRVDDVVRYAQVTAEGNIRDLGDFRAIVRGVRPYSTVSLQLGRQGEEQSVNVRFVAVPATSDPYRHRKVVVRRADSVSVTSSPSSRGSTYRTPSPAPRPPTGHTTSSARARPDASPATSVKSGWSGGSRSRSGSVPQTQPIGAETVKAQGEGFLTPGRGPFLSHIDFERAADNPLWKRLAELESVQPQPPAQGVAQGQPRPVPLPQL